MVFPESKNNAFILVARAFCNQKNMNIYSYRFAFILYWFILIFNVDCKLRK